MAYLALNEVSGRGCAPASERAATPKTTRRLGSTEAQAPAYHAPSRVKAVSDGSTVRTLRLYSESLVGGAVPHAYHAGRGGHWAVLLISGRILNQLFVGQRVALDQRPQASRPCYSMMLLLAVLFLFLAVALNIYQSRKDY